MQEPVWGYNLLLFLNEYMKYHNFLLISIPITADVFVFFYPVLLVILYLVGLFKNKDYYKESALWIFWSGVLSMLFNIVVQFFCDKVRPNILLGLEYEKIETILHKFLPQSSFPSDHVAMSMGIAVGIILWGTRNKDKKFIYMGIVFVLFSLITGVSRVMVGVHRPTDIIAGSIIGILIPVILFQKNIYKFFKKILIIPLINLQKTIWKLFGVKY
ncbi:MAG TPA: phosphatase PAP2 family protein [Candidatus Absconditabacterales bacterium]|nr:phosphatase PAP2 family protein [Candidatus Absconditabacterales bacterium]